MPELFSTHPIGFSIPEALLFAGLSFLLFYCPGSLLLRLSKHPMERGEAFCFSWVLGYLFTVTAYALCARLHRTGIFPALLIAANGIYWLFYFRKDFKGWRKPYSFRLEWLPYAACLIFMAVSTWIAVDSWSDFSDQGLKLTGVLHSDILNGTAVAAVMKIAIQPDYPLLAGQKYFYHYFPFIGLTIFSKYFSMPLLPLTFVYFQILTLSLFFLTVACLASRIFTDSWMRFTAAFLTVLVGHFEFKIGYTVGYMYFFWGLYFFSVFLENRGRKSLVFCCLLWGAILSSMTVLSLMILPSVVLFSLLYAVRKSPHTLALLQLSGGVLVSHLVWYWISFEPGSGAQGTAPLVQIDFPLAPYAEEYLRIFSPDFPEFLSQIKGQIPDDLANLLFRKMNLLRLLFAYGIEGLAFLVLSAAFLDLALVGLGSALRSFWKKAFLSNSALGFAGWTGALGVVCSWFLEWVEPAVTLTYYRASYVLLLFYSVVPLFEFFRRPGRRFFKVLLLSVILYIVPYKTVGMVAGLRNGLDYTLTPPEILEAYTFIRKEVPPADLMIHPLVREQTYSPDGQLVKESFQDNYLFPILTEKRSFFIRLIERKDFVQNVLPGSDQERRKDWEEFFKTENSEEAFRILGKYGIRWVISTREKPLRFSPGNHLQPVYQNSLVTVFRYLAA